MYVYESAPPLKKKASRNPRSHANRSARIQQKVQRIHETAKQIDLDPSFIPAMENRSNGFSGILFSSLLLCLICGFAYYVTTV